MLINGFQKMTLLDYPGHVACTVFTGGCNLRCPFCHNALLVTEVADLEVIPEEDVFSLLKKRRGILDGVAITGGEPLLQKDIRTFIEKVRELGFKVKLDTNGTFPEKLKELVLDGLVDYVAVDVKNCPEKYAGTTGADSVDLNAVEETIAFLLENHVPYEFRTTVVKEFHTTEDIVKIGRWIYGAERYFLQNFVDSGNLIGEGMHAVSKEELFAMRDAVKPFVKEVNVRGVD